MENGDQTLEHQEGTTPPEDGTQIPKFKSAEERDAAYIELEKRAHSQSQELAELKRKMDDFEASKEVQRPAQGEQFTDVYKSQEELKKFWERFAAKPQEVFGEWASQTMKAVEERIAYRDHARDAVAEFKAKNPDLAPYEEIVGMFVQRQPENLSARDRLERAAPEARKMIASIAQRGSNSPQGMQDPNTFVEPPSGTRTSGAPKATAKEENAVDEYLREQAEIAFKRQSPPRIGK